MQSYNLTIEDSVAEKILTFLNNFSPSQVQLEKIEPTNNNDTLAITRIEDLYGVLSPYVHGYLSDDDIENAIGEGASDSGMAGKK